jgi:hypothetical protein
MNAIRSSKTVLFVFLAIVIAVSLYFFYFGAKPVVKNQDVALASYTNEKGQKWDIPKGEINFQVSSGENYPKFVVGFISPLDVKVGDRQKMKIAVNGDAPITRAWAEIETDNSVKMLELELVSTSTISAADLMKQPYLVDKDGTVVVNDENNAVAEKVVKLAEAAAPVTQYQFEGEWIVEDTHTRTYHTKFVAEDSVKRTDSMTLAWSDPCNFIYNELASNCSVAAGVESVDGSNMIIGPSNTLTLSGTAVLAFAPGNKITFSSGSKIVLTGGSSKIKEAYTCATDSDTDGYPGNSGVRFTSPASNCGGSPYRRISALITMNPIADCNDGSNVAWTNGYGVDSDGDNYGLSGYGCNNGAGNRTASAGQDCYDSNANARPSQTKYFGYIRGVSPDGGGNTGNSFDYNCDSSQSLGGWWRADDAGVGASTVYPGTLCKYGSTYPNYALQISDAAAAGCGFFYNSSDLYWRTLLSSSASYPNGCATQLWVSDDNPQVFCR